MNIKRIIQEEIDDFDFVKDTDPAVYEGMLFYYHEEDEENLYKVIELTDEYDAYIGRPSDTERESHHTRYPINKVIDYIRSGEWIVYKD